MGNHISKIFKKALIDIGADSSKHLHSIRHTFAVRRYLQTRDTYQVKQEMGYSSVTNTEIYAKFSLRRLEMDFPSLVKSNNNREKRELGYDNLGYTQKDKSLTASIIST